jgi:hypothetical protein
VTTGFVEATALEQPASYYKSPNEKLKISYYRNKYVRYSHSHYPTKKPRPKDQGAVMRDTHKEYKKASLQGGYTNQIPLTIKPYPMKKGRYELLVCEGIDCGQENSLRCFVTKLFLLSSYE